MIERAKWRGLTKDHLKINPHAVRRKKSLEPEVSFAEIRNPNVF